MLIKFKHSEGSEVKFVFHSSNLWGYFYNTCNPPISIRLNNNYVIKISTTLY